MEEKCNQKKGGSQKAPLLAVRSGTARHSEVPAHEMHMFAARPCPLGKPGLRRTHGVPLLTVKRGRKCKRGNPRWGGFGGWRWRGALPVYQGRSPGRVKGNPVTRVACTPFSRTQPLLPWKKEGGSGRGSQSKSLLNKDGRKPCPQGPADPGRPFRADIHVPATVSRDGGDGARGRRWGREGGHPLT